MILVWIRIKVKVTSERYIQHKGPHRPKGNAGSRDLYLGSSGRMGSSHNRDLNGPSPMQGQPSGFGNHGSMQPQPFGDPGSMQINQGFPSRRSIPPSNQGVGGRGGGEFGVFPPFGSDPNSAFAQANAYERGREAGSAPQTYKSSSGPAGMVSK